MPHSKIPLLVQQLRKKCAYLALGLFFLPHIVTLLSTTQLLLTTQRLKTAAFAALGPVFSAAAPATRAPSLELTLRAAVKNARTLNSFLPLTISGRTPLLALTTMLEYILVDSSEIVTFLSQDTVRVHVWLQNTHELRATGGFVGSYAELIFAQGKLQSLMIHDIYEPDGQFSGYREAPPGIRTYLAGNNGWRLPDANWSPDFAQSVADFNWFLQQTSIQAPDITLAVNLSTIEKMLAITGPLYVSDFDQTVTSENFAQVARRNRDEFFPGDHQKSQLLTLLFNQLKYRLQMLDLRTQLSVVGLLWHDLTIGEIQAHTDDAQVTAILKKYQPESKSVLLQQPSATDQNTLLIFPIESNVGINKANAKNSRTLDLEVTDALAKITLSFANDNQPPLPADKPRNPDHHEADHLAYVNYLRLLLPEHAQILTVQVGETLLEKWDQQVVHFGESDFLEIGFLVVVPEQKNNSAVITLAMPTSIQTVQVIKQSGIPPLILKSNLNGAENIDEIENYWLHIAH